MRAAGGGRGGRGGSGGGGGGGGAAGRRGRAGRQRRGARRGAARSGGGGAGARGRGRRGRGAWGVGSARRAAIPPATAHGEAGFVKPGRATVSWLPFGLATSRRAHVLSISTTHNASRIQRMRSVVALAQPMARRGSIDRGDLRRLARRRARSARTTLDLPLAPAAMAALRRAGSMSPQQTNCCTGIRRAFLVNAPSLAWRRSRCEFPVRGVPRRCTCAITTTLT